MTTAPITAHPTYRAMLARIREAPNDNGLRLLTADWLEEQGCLAWAEVIRLDLLPVTAGNRLWKLLPAARAAAMAGLPHEVMRCAFTRGFVTAVRLTSPNWLVYGSAILDAQPVIEVELRDKWDDQELHVEDVAEHQPTARLQSLILPRGVSVTDRLWLAQRLPHVHVSLSGNLTR